MYRYLHPALECPLLFSFHGAGLCHSSWAKTCKQVQESRSDTTGLPLQEQALGALSHAADNYSNVVFPCALITGDVVILDLLSRLGYLHSGRVPVIFIDTFHLFPETHSFLHSLEV